MERAKCPDCGMPTIPDRQGLEFEAMLCEACYDKHYWQADLDPCDPDNYWIDRRTGERVNAHTNERSK